MKADLQPLIDSVNKIEDVADSATALINGFSERIQKAIDKALENGATEAELQPFIAEKAELDAKSDALAAAVAANTVADEAAGG